jgi:hypothetical protein
VSFGLFTCARLGIMREERRGGAKAKRMYFGRRVGGNTRSREDFVARELAARLRSAEDQVHARVGRDCEQVRCVSCCVEESGGQNQCTNRCRTARRL